MTNIHDYPNPEAARTARVAARLYEGTVISLLSLMPTSSLDDPVLGCTALKTRRASALGQTVQFTASRADKSVLPDLGLTITRLDQLERATSLASIDAAQQGEHRQFERERRDLALLFQAQSAKSRDAGADYLRNVLDLIRALPLYPHQLEPALRHLPDTAGVSLIGTGFALLGPDSRTLTATYLFSELGAEYAPERLLNRTSTNARAYRAYRNHVLEFIALASRPGAAGGESADPNSPSPSNPPTPPTSVAQRLAEARTHPEEFERARRQNTERHHLRALGDSMHSKSEETEPAPAVGDEPSI